MNQPVVLGIDAGTSMTKVVAFDLAGNELYRTSMKTPTSTPHTSWIEEDMSEVWNSVSTCLREAASNVDGEIKAIGITATGDGTWMVDEKMEPVRPGIMWCDGRAHEEVSTWHADGTARKAFSRCGTSVFTGTQAAQIRWLEKHEPDSLQRAKYIFHEKDWIFYKLTGVVSTDDSDQSLTHIDLWKKEYDLELLRIFGIEKYRDKLPDLTVTAKNFAPLAADVGIPKGTLVASGPMDVEAHALGVGAINHGQGSSVLGTAGLHQVVMDDPHLEGDMVGMTLTHTVPNRWLRLNASMIATPNADWILDILGERDGKDFDYEKLDANLSKIPVGSRGVVYQPYIFPGGERAPFVNAHAKGGFFGLNQHHNRYDLIHAVYEGVGLSMKDCYEHMPVDVNGVRLSGGGANSEFWSQLVCDIVGHPIEIPNGTEYGAKGAAINAAVAGGLFSSFEEATGSMISISRRYTPNESKADAYTELYQVFLDLRRAHASLWHRRTSFLDKFGGGEIGESVG